MADRPGSSYLHHPFTPWLAPPDVLMRTLVGRTELLEDLLRGVAGTREGASANHVLLVGPRGIGKTHVLCLVHHVVAGRLDTPGDLPGPVEGWAPVLFAEEEYAAQNSLANFLMSLFEKLSEEHRADDVWRLPDDLWKQEDRAVCECCLERITSWHGETGGRLLLLIDNLQLMLEQWGPDEHDRLRAFLSGQGHVLIIGTAPSVFGDVMGQRAAFHDFFEVRPMADLTTEQVLDLLARRFREEGRQAEYDARESELRRKVPALQTLAGGNPRLVLFLYDIVTKSAFLEVEQALRHLLEGLREYFVQRLGELPRQERKVLDTLAQMPGPATPTEIAQSARLSVDLVNSQLQRLRKRHHVRALKLKPQRITRYDINDRLFRIWRQTATVAGRRRFRFLSDFLKLYYAPDEVRTMCAEHIRALRSDTKCGRDAVMRHVEELFYLQSAVEGELRAEAFTTRVESLLRIGEFGWAEGEVRYFASEASELSEKGELQAAYKAQSAIHLASGQFDEAVKDVGSLLDIGASEDAAKVAGRLVAESPTVRHRKVLAVVLFRGGRYVDALDASRRVAEVAEERHHLWMLEAAALSALDRQQEAIECAEQGVRSAPEKGAAWAVLGALVANSGDQAWALEAFQRAVEFGEPTAELLRLQSLALSNLGRHDEALQRAERAVELGPEDAAAWERLGRACGSSGDYARVLEALQRAVELGKPTPELWKLQSLALSFLHRDDEALQYAEHAVQLGSQDAALWECLGTAAGNSGDYARALETFQRAAELGKPTSTIWQLQSWALSNLGRHDEALHCAERAVELGPEDAEAWEWLGRAVGVSGDYARTLEAFQRAAELGEPTPELWRLQSKALQHLGRPGEALEAIEAAAERGGSDENVLLQKVWVLSDLGHTEQAVEAAGMARGRGASERDVCHACGDVLLLGGRYAEAAESLEGGLRVEPEDWDLRADLETALACLGRRGPWMEALPGEIERIDIPESEQQAVGDFLLELGERCLARGEGALSLGLYRTVLSMRAWQGASWFGSRVGVFLRKMLDRDASHLAEMVRLLRELVDNEDVLELLNPFVQAADLMETKDVTILERLFPEVRELVLDIVSRVDPGFENELRTKYREI